MIAAPPAYIVRADQALPRPAHVVIVVEENKSSGQVIGSVHAPYINELATQGALFTNSWAITHPSQPNYIALYSGQTNSNGDDCPAAGIDSASPNLGSELIAARLTFAGYSETMPRAGYDGCAFGVWPFDYARKHNPWVNFSNVPSLANLPLREQAPFDRLPTIAFIVPNEYDDMHSGPISTGDAWLKRHVGPIIDWAQTHDTLVIITWDEADRDGPNVIPTIFVGPMVRAGRYDERIDHYRVLRTLEDMYGLPHAGNSASQNPIVDCWR